MSNAITTTEERRLALEEHETLLIAAGHRTLDATAEMGRILNQIRSQELWRARTEYSFWSDYVEGYLGLTSDLASRWINVYLVKDRVAEAGLMLPANESQAAELARVPEDRQLAVWSDVVNRCEENNLAVTVYAIKKAADIDGRTQLELEAKAEKRRAKTAAKKGLTISMDDEDEDEEQGANGDVPKPFFRLSEDGEAALEKIRSVCGDQIAEAIEGLRISITERDLIKWASQPSNQAIHNLAYYIANRWSLGKAIDYETRLIDGSTTIDNLFTLTRARGGRYAIAHDDGRITIEIG